MAPPRHLDFKFADISDWEKADVAQENFVTHAVEFFGHAHCLNVREMPNELRFLTFCYQCLEQKFTLKGVLNEDVARRVMRNIVRRVGSILIYLKALRKELDEKRRTLGQSGLSLSATT
jgi:hypothetical protein